MIHSYANKGERNSRRILPFAVLAFTVAALGANAAGVTNVTISSVAQRWPWNNKVDITYTVQGGQSRADGAYCGLRFALTAGGRTYDFEGYTVGASAEDGTHTVTWTAPQGIVAADCSLTATLFSTNFPSGNDYMIVDLDSGDVVYEGMLATQTASNERYNTATFKTDKLVLRKIPRTADSASLPNGPFASGYRIGDTANFPSTTADGWDQNTDQTRTTDRDYYIGVFPVTQRQYEKLYGENPSTKKTTISGNVTGHRPVEAVSWDALRLADTAPTSSIPAVASNTGTFFQRLKYLTGNRFEFDLPTEVMFEIAERAGSTKAYFWGDTPNADYVVCKDNAGPGTAAGGTDGSTVAVGSRIPNEWGLYDMAGNTYEWCLDQYVWGNPGRNLDAFTPANSNTAASGTKRRVRGGGGFGSAVTASAFRASYRYNAEKTAKGWTYGFRVSLIVD